MLKNTSSLTFKKGLKDGIPIALAYLSVSFAFGVTAVELGVPNFIALLISMTNLTSAGQLAGVAIIAVLGSAFELILTQVVINARYFLMSLALSQKLDNKFTLLDRLLCAFGITDEIFAVAVSNKENVNKFYMFGLILLPFIGWSSGTIIGALMGDILPKFIVSALNIALYAMFIGIIFPAALVNKKIFPVVFISASLSAIFFFVPGLNQISSGISCIICSIIASIIGALIFPNDDEKEGER